MTVPVGDAGRCAAVADALSEPGFATAGVARAWILIEHPLPWPRQALVDGFDSDVAAQLLERAGSGSVKVLAVRTHDRGQVGRQIFVASSHPSGPWLERAVIRDERELLDLDMAALAAGQRPGLGEVDPEALYLVCTHGARDACCGIRGRPLADALARARPGRVWECSHLGGHRFAPNLVCIPTGLVYGRVQPEQALALVRAHEHGEMNLERLRGRSFHPPAVQAAEHFLRQQLNLVGIDAIAPLSVSEQGSGVVEIVLSTGAGSWAVTVCSVPTGRARALSCGSPEGEDPHTFELLALASHRTGDEGSTAGG